MDKAVAPPPGAIWLVGELERAWAAAGEQGAEQLRDLDAVAVADFVDLDTGARHGRIIETANPFFGGAQQFGLARHNEDGVQAAHGLQLDQMLAEAVFPRIQNFFEFGHQRLGLRAMDRKNTDRLAAHPILVEAKDSIDSGAALGSVADDEKQVVCWVGPDRTGFCREAFQEFGDRLHRNVPQRDHRDSVTRLQIAALARAIDVAAADGVVRRNDMVAPGIVHQYRIARVQGALQDEQHLGFRNRTSRGKADGSLHPRVDRITYP